MDQPLLALEPTITLQTPRTDFPILINALQAWHPNPVTGWPTKLRPLIAPLGGSGILTGCPSPTPSGLGLGPTNPTRINLPSETLDIRRTRFSRVSRYSCQHSHFCTLHRSSQYGFSACRTLPYHSSQTSVCEKPVASVASLSPVKFSARTRLTSELLRTL